MSGAPEIAPGQMLGAIFSASPDAIVVVDTEAMIVMSSPSVTALFGYYPQELVGASLATLLPMGDREVHAKHLEAYFATPTPRQMGAGLKLAGRHRDGRTFPVDVSLAPVRVRGRAYAAAFVRDVSERERALDRLRAVNEITQQLLSGTGAEEIFSTVARRARTLSRSDAVWIVLPEDDGELRIVSADGPGAEVLLGVRLSGSTSRSANVMATGSPEIVAELSAGGNVPDHVAGLGLGPALYVPLVAPGRRVGTLVLARHTGAAVYEPLDVAFAEVFASSIATAVELGEARAEVERLGLVAEDERIARDLHDTVIQQLFAIGMSLQAMRATLPGPPGERIDDAIDRLDGVIREIRNTIFRLPERASARAGLRDALISVIEAFSDELGFSPRIAFDGPVDAAVPGEIGENLVSVLTEGLSNVARHAHASRADAVVSIADGRLVLRLLDDGIGVEGHPSAGRGLRNIAARAKRLGGTFQLTAREPTGSLLEWSVPL